MVSIQSLINLGLSDKQPNNVQEAIKLCNILTLLLIPFAITYIFIAYFLIPPVLPIYVFGTPLAIMVLVFNYFGLTLLSRFIVALVPMLSNFFFHIIILNEGEEQFYGIIISTMGLWIIPWLLFDLKQYPILIFTSLISVLTVLLVPYANTWIEVNFNNQPFRNQTFEWVFAFSGGAVFFLSMIALQYSILRLDNRNKKLIQEMQNREWELENSQLDLKKFIEKLTLAQEKEKKRKWAIEGQAKFGTMLRSYEDMQELSNALISALVKYLNAQQGGLYVVRKDTEEAPFIRLIAGYAVSFEKIQKRDFLLEEGLLGQVYAGSKSIYLDEIPEDYFHISSGLGEAKPRFLLVAPLKNEGIVEGMIEINSFYPFESYQIDFVENIGEIIASALNTNHKNHLLKKLLSESQEQTEKSLAQEEELRQNMEELQATHENQQRLQKELKQKIEELETAKTEIEQIKIKEAERAKEQIEKRNKMIDKTLQIFKQKEKEMQEILNEKEKEIATLKEKVNS